MNLFFTIFTKIKTKILAFWETYIARYGKSVKDGYKSNAFSPLVWFNVFTIPLILILIYFIKSEIIQMILAGLLIISVLFTLLMYFLLFKKDPKLLQSEWYRIQDKKLDMISEKGGEIKIRRGESAKLDYD